MYFSARKKNDHSQWRCRRHYFHVLLGCGPDREINFCTLNAPSYTDNSGIVLLVLRRKIGDRRNSMRGSVYIPQHVLNFQEWKFLSSISSIEGTLK